MLERGQRRKTQRRSRVDCSGDKQGEGIGGKQILSQWGSGVEWSRQMDGMVYVANGGGVE